MLQASLGLLEADATRSFYPPTNEIAVMLSWCADTDQLTSSFDSSFDKDLTFRVPFLSAVSKSLSFGLTLINSGASSRFLLRFFSGERGLSDKSILGAIVTFWTPKSADETKSYLLDFLKNAIDLIGLVQIWLDLSFSALAQS